VLVIFKETPEEKNKRLAAVRKSFEYRQQHETSDERHERLCHIKHQRDYRNCTRFTVPVPKAEPKAVIIEHEL